MYKYAILFFGLVFLPFTTSSQSTNYIPSDSLIGFYDFKNDFTDSSPNNYHGSVSGSIPFVEDRNGFTESAIQLGNGAGLLPSDIFKFTRDDKFTVSFWFTHESDGNDRLISTECPEGNFRVSNLSGNVSLQFGDYLTPELKAPEDWNHIVYTYDNRNENVFLNGELVLSNTDTKDEVLNPYCNSFVVGAKASSTVSDRWNGKFDDLGIWNRVLNGDEVMSLYKGERFSISENISISIKDSSFVETSFIDAQVYVDSVAWYDSLSAYQFDLIIPAKLGFRSIDTTGTLSNNGLIEYNLSNDTLAIAYSGQEFLSGKSQDLIKIRFDVSSADDYTVQLKNLYLNATETDSTVQGLISYSPLLGDVDNNLSIQAYDASLVLMNSVGKNGLSSDPLPWKNWRKTSADVNKDGKVLADDASQILQKSIGLIDVFEKVKTKKTDPIIEVEVIEDTLIFTSLNNQLFGANINIEAANDLELLDPIYTKSGMLTAENKTEEYFKIGIASSEEIDCPFLKLPYISEANQDLNIELYSNSKHSFKTVSINKTATSSELDSEIPSRFILKQNYPNPFNPSTTISFTIPSSTFATVEVFNVAGAKIATLINTYLNAGHHSVSFDGSNLSTGVYFYKLKTTEFEQVKNMVLIK